MDDRGNIKASAYGEEAIEPQTKLMSEHIRSKMITKLCLYALTAFLAVAASLLIVFAPPERETATWILAGALVAAVGSAGFSAFAIRTPKLSTSVGQADESRTRTTEAQSSRRSPGA